MQKIEKYLDNITNKMAKTNQEVVFEGWLTKSPPTKRILRARWRRRWFSLTQGELPGQYVLNYYTDRNCRHLKGVINLDHCEQVDLGLRLEERKLKFDHVFDIKTPTRTYYLAADTEVEMRSWVKCICKVCGLRADAATNDDEESRISGNLSNMPSDVEVVEEDSGTLKRNNITPVSTSPYIPISECMTGKYPVFDRQELNSLTQKVTSWQNNTYGTGSSQKIYLNYVNDIQMFYDSPRSHIAKSPPNDTKLDQTADQGNDGSPLQSPTDSENVFIEGDWTDNASSEGRRVKRPSTGSIDLDLIATQKFTKTEAPPRPPKPTNVVLQNSPNYLNLSLPPSSDQKDPTTGEVTTNNESQKIVTDEMYDFPRSHHVETDTLRHSFTRRHCYNNAAPVRLDGQIFKYDISPKPSTSQVFRYDLNDTQEEPASPHSQGSSTPAYSNLPSPLLTETQLMPPPIVHRELKPKRKLSDSLSICSMNEPPSPRSAPSVDRKLKPPTPLQEAHMRRNANMDEDRRLRAAPSPSPLSRAHSDENLPSPLEGDYIVSKMQYLDLDLDCKIPSSSSVGIVKNESSTVYKEVDFKKTHAFNITKNILEKERQDTVAFHKK
ncbi:protein daughter of sevenless [Coccinella septempunctata]|uniref:protein daughter of sevenless n=1 Tax=Coccinella septempunctata TaxID=41139 RepID=UPI001D0727DA|nr:protein daughter of sevenless [Coccinella septempunctata]